MAKHTAPWGRLTVYFLLIASAQAQDSQPASTASQPHANTRQHVGIRSFFNELDDNKDGQIEAHEAQRYIATQLDGVGSTPGATLAATKLLTEVDGGDTDDTVSESELERSLTQRLQVCVGHAFRCHALCARQGWQALLCSSDSSRASG
jgi:hypothetical protein